MEKFTQEQIAAIGDLGFSIKFLARAITRFTANANANSAKSLLMWVEELEEVQDELGIYIYEQEALQTLRINAREYLNTLLIKE